jgi:hypothetical protein
MFPLAALLTTITAIPAKAEAIATQVRARTASPSTIQPSSAAMKGEVERMISVFATCVSDSESTYIVEATAKQTPTASAAQPASLKRASVRPRSRQKM